VVDSAQLVGGCQWGWREEERRKAFGGKNILGEIAAVFVETQGFNFLFFFFGCDEAASWGM